MKHWLRLALVIAAVLRLHAQAPSLFSQSAAAQLEREFPSTAVSFLLLDARSGAVLAARWDDAARPLPLGSLLKPFTALAYARGHESFPVRTCVGGDRCWYPRGHGRVSIETAIAHSCNAYFELLAAQVEARYISAIAYEYGIDAPSTFSSRSLVGLTDEWKISPLNILRAYRTLATRGDDPAVASVLAGMAESPRHGTAHLLGERLRTPALTKTGTAACTHRKHGAADGYTIALVPAEAPRFALLVGVHGVTGANAANVAGQMLHAILERSRAAD
jgi:cell division protein FtsI/penicillin-binding protein 2